MKYFLLGRVPPAFAKRRRANAGFLKTSRVVWAADEKGECVKWRAENRSEFVHAARKRPKSDQANDPQRSYGMRLCRFQGTQARRTSPFLRLPTQRTGTKSHPPTGLPADPPAT